MSKQDSRSVLLNFHNCISTKKGIPRSQRSLRSFVKKRSTGNKAFLSHINKQHRAVDPRYAKQHLADSPRCMEPRASRAHSRNAHAATRASRKYSDLAPRARLSLFPSRGSLCARGPLFFFLARARAEKSLFTSWCVPRGEKRENARRSTREDNRRARARVSPLLLPCKFCNLHHPRVCARARGTSEIQNRRWCFLFLACFFFPSSNNIIYRVRARICHARLRTKTAE